MRFQRERHPYRFVAAVTSGQQLGTALALVASPLVRAVPRRRR
jgi:hypothetical protein